MNRIEQRVRPSKQNNTDKATQMYRSAFMETTSVLTPMVGALSCLQCVPAVQTPQPNVVNWVILGRRIYLWLTFSSMGVP
jgi:hypothetical protein